MAQTPFELLPPEISGDYNTVLRKQKIMEALLAQGLQGYDPPKVKGRFEVASGPAGAIGQIAQAFVGSRGLKDADAQMTDISKRYQQGQQGEMEDVLKLMQGGTYNRPDLGMAGMTGSLDQQDIPRQMEAVPGDPKAAISKALMSQYPGVQRLGTAMVPNLRNQVVGRSLLGPDGKVLGTDPVYGQEKAADREQQLLRDRLRSEARVAENDQRAADREALARTIAGLRPDRAEPAPALTQVIDPKDSSRMLSVDARVYKPGGSLGDPGVLGIAGKEPQAKRASDAKEEGKVNLKEAISSLADTYTNLENMGAGVSPTQNPLVNIYERAAASGPGQFIAGAVGTEAQTERDKIASFRANLLSSIKAATGMSAQQLNSNVELSFYLQAATDPTKSREANQAALAYFDKRFNLGLGLKAPERGVKDLGLPKTVPSTPPATPATPDGYNGPRIDNTIVPPVTGRDKVEQNLRNINKELARKDITPRGRQILENEKRAEEARLGTMPAPEALRKYNPATGRIE